MSLPRTEGLSVHFTFIMQCPGDLNKMAASTVSFMKPLRVTRMLLIRVCTVQLIFPPLRLFTKKTPSWNEISETSLLQFTHTGRHSEWSLLFRDTLESGIKLSTHRQVKLTEVVLPIPKNRFNDATDYLTDSLQVQIFNRLRDLSD